MTENTKSIVNELYALRAGLSLASSENDKAASMIDDFKRRNDSFKQQTEQNALEIMNNENTYTSNRDKITNDRNTLKNSYNAQKSFSTFAYIFLLSIGIILVAIAFGIIALQIYDIVEDPRWTKVLDGGLGKFMSTIQPLFKPFGFMLAGIVASPAAGIFMILEKSTASKKSRAQIQKQLNALGGSDADVNVKLQADYVAMTEKNKKIRDKEIEVGNALASDKPIIEKEARAISVVGKGIYDSLIPHYSTILDVRDWKNLDLIIYLLETGRADTMKEALQQVDVYRHTEQIVTAIKEASSEICRTIQAGMDRLNSTILSCSNMISDNLGKIAESQGNLLDELKLTNDNLQGLARIENVQAALLAKASTSSERLINDVEELQRNSSRVVLELHRSIYC